MASIVCLSALQQVDRAGALLGRRIEPCPLGPIGDDPFLGLDGGEKLGLDAAIELGAVFLGDVGRRADHVLGQAQGIQGGFGLVLIQERPSALDSLLDVVGQLLPRDVLGGLGLFEGGLGIDLRGAGGTWAGSAAGLSAPVGGWGAGGCAAGGSCTATWTTPASARSMRRSPRAAAALAGSSWSAFLKKVFAAALAPWASACRPRSAS